MNIHVVETAAVDRIKNNVGRRMRRKTHKTAAAFTLQFARRFETATWFKSISQMVSIVDPMKREQIHIIELEIIHRLAERLDEITRVRFGRDLGLHDQLLTG